MACKGLFDFLNIYPMLVFDLFDELTNPDYLSDFHRGLLNILRSLQYGSMSYLSPWLGWLAQIESVRWANFVCDPALPCKKGPGGSPTAEGSRAAIEDECSICHVPMARFQAKVAGQEGQIFAHFPFNPEKDADRFVADGVSCSLCHQITTDKLGTRESFVGGFVVDATKLKGERAEYGPYRGFPASCSRGRLFVCVSPSVRRVLEGEAPLAAT
jgi:hypothetical protein